MKESRVTLYIAASIDGFVADDEGGVGWLDEFGQDAENTDTVDAYEDFFASVDCLVVGATTYEQILTFGEWPYEDRPTYVFTHRDLPRATEAVSFVDGDIGSLATELRREYEHVWLVGGAQLARAFLADGQVDELRLSLVPVLLGSGVPLFRSGGEPHGLEHLETRTYDTGIVELRYEIDS